MKIKLILLVAFIFNISTSAQNAVELKKAPDNMTAETIFENYIKALGVIDAIKNVNTVDLKADVAIAGAPMSISAEIKLMKPNYESVEMSAVGMGIISKQKFNGETGYAEQQGMKIDLTEEQINSKKGKHSIFPELYPKDYELTLEGVTTLKEKEVYKVKIVQGENITYKYYDTENYLLVRAEMDSKAQGKSSMELSDYRAVNGILFPHKQIITAGMQIITMTYTYISFNKDVTEADFY